jgi:hypothetical protein
LLWKDLLTIEQQWLLPSPCNARESSFQERPMQSLWNPTLKELRGRPNPCSMFLVDLLLVLQLLPLLQAEVDVEAEGLVDDLLLPYCTTCRSCPSCGQGSR